MDIERYAELFQTESREHLSVINQSLLALERALTSTPGTPPASAKGARRAGGPRTVVGAEAIDSLFRSVHTIKGMSATMGYESVAALSHEMETVLDRLRAGELAASAAAMDVLFAAADALECAIERAVVARAADPRVAEPIARLQALAERPGADAPAAPRASRPRRGRSAKRPAGPKSGRAKPVAPRAAVESAAADDLVDVADIPQSPSAAPPAAADGGGGARGDGEVRTRHVRIDLRRLDALMNLIGELVITRGRLLELTSAQADSPLGEAVADAGRLIADLQDEIMTCRMVPVWQVFDRFPRLVRDAAHSLGKQVAFAVEGKDIELDRSMLDEIGDPIVHLLRNAIDHGIESPATRAAAGKPAQGRLTLSAVRDRSAVLIQVTDNGRGIDRAKVLTRALESGLVEPTTTALSDDEVIRLIARPGFSTADQVTDLSGRGVGIDAVQARVRALGGSVDIRSAPGEGTTVTARLPLTLAIMRALLARVGPESYAFPMAHVDETVSTAGAAFAAVRGQPVLILRGEALPYLRLRELVALPPVPGESPTAEPEQHVIVVEAGGRRAAIAVDELAGQADIVVKPYDAVRGGQGLFAGATILGDGAPALIVNVSSLL